MCSYIGHFMLTSTQTGFRGILFSNSLRIKLMILKDQKIYYLHCEDLQREFLRPPLDKTPAAVKIYKFQMKVETKIAAFLAKLKRKLKAVKVTTTTSGLWVTTFR